MQSIKTLQSRHLFTMYLEVAYDRIYSIGNVPTGRRIIAPVDGGRFEGDRLRGEVLPDGADWVRFRSDGVMEIDVRTTLKTSDDALIFLRYRGLAHASPENMQRFIQRETQPYENVYARTSLTFETEAPQYAWLNKVIAVANGTRTDTGPMYEVFEIT
ncbi:DUF3237 domain-containing protein [Glaciimonas sp. CA11.2]|uniref:DUF3237 domain-containing protein n=1 Tax=Glaciimonas sp. CA11.2 TaxID=3048601 RepID=UPI002AB34472|nr:DUF3237 domain-containing protein [Glaciimonas sp. CA11.2]MDY7547720.1 DUF3237 domain-containing protein [Glaciimonas sp. CA11.2]MEB0161363.1 DUF3237 domain-containing protein [Glaciimonas sp. CA11.2]